MKSLLDLNLREVVVIEVLKALVVSLVDTLKYYYAFYLVLWKKKKYHEIDIFEDDLWAKCQVLSLLLIFKLWDKKHYRSPSFQQDMIDNLKNVAIPGTGIPLSTFCYSKIICLLFILFINPLICFIGSVNKSWKYSTTTQQFLLKIFEYYSDHLLHPDDWFSFWRLNCRLVSYHSLLTQTDGYTYENKWSFLVEGKKLNIPISPYIDNIEAIVCKNVNIEGGMGIHFFKNAASGGEWIIQEKLTNAKWLQELLPYNSPLSTMRIITTSTWSLDCDKSSIIKSLRSGSTTNLNIIPPSNSTDLNDPNTITTTTITTTKSLGLASSSSITSKKEIQKYIKVQLAVLRLGRENASTDHSSILFNVDINTGIIDYGTTNAQWYILGVLNAWQTCPWLSMVTYTSHPDDPQPVVTGKVVPEMKQAIDIVTSAHMTMMKDVPIIGWDVAFTDKGIFLLEVNLSCNFFKGKFNKLEYIAFVNSYFTRLSQEDHL